MPGSDSGGGWTYQGYNNNYPGSPGSGGTSIGTLTGDNPGVDFEGFIPGYYHFEYCVGVEDCTDCHSLVIHVQEKGTAGTGDNASYCVNDSISIDLSDHISGESIGGVWGLNANSPGDPEIAFDSSTGTLDLSLINTPGQYLFDYIVDLNGSENFDPQDCLSCRSIASVTITITSECDAGENNSLQITSTTGQINLFSQLNGTPDPNGVWTQLSGSTVTIEGGHQGLVNLDSAQGCSWEFQYECIAPPGCKATAVITIVKNVTFNISIIQNEEQLEATTNGCSGSISYQWQRLIGSTWTNISGETTNTLTNLINGGIYRILGSCDGCEFTSNIVTYQIDCDCNDPGVSFAFDQNNDCLDIVPSGGVCSTISTDQYLIRIPAGSGSWIAHNVADSICGCDLREFLDVTPACFASSTHITIGFSSASKCSGNIDRVLIKYGNDTLETNVNSGFTSFSRAISKNDFINLYNRKATMIVRLNLGNGNYLFQEVEFQYNGSTSSGDNCSLVNITKLNFPKLYSSVEARRIVSFVEDCDPVVFTDIWTSGQECDNLYVVLTVVNLGGDNGISGEVFNCGSPSRQWYKDGVLLTGETGFFINTTTYGDGYYELRATCGDCIRWGSINISSCDVTVSLSGPSSGTYTATVNNCTGTKTYYWEKLEGGSWNIVSQNTTNSNTNTFTPSSGGTYRIRVSCEANGCQASQNFTHTFDCNVTASITQSGNNLVATASGCSGSKTYTFQRWNGNNWVQVNQQTTSSNSVNYTPTQNGLYRVVLLCAVNDCEDIDQTLFTFDCDVEVTVTESGGVYTGSFTGCAGSRTWAWQRWDGSSWITVQSQSNSNSTNQYAPTEDGLYRLVVICASNNCQDSYQFNHSEECDISVSIIADDPLLTGNQTGCNGSAQWTWYYRSTPGSGNWGSPVSFSQSINTTSFGAGEYRLDLSCGGCTETAYYTLVVCQLGVSINCSNNDPYTAVGTGCTSGGSYIWQYSPSGTGWQQVGTGSTHTPNSGTGWYRVIFSCPGCNSVSAQCYYNAPCDVTATISADNDKGDFKTTIWQEDITSGYEVWINGNKVIDDDYNLNSQSGRNQLKSDIESWLDSNGFGGTVSYTFDVLGKDVGICISINCTKSTPDRVVSKNYGSLEITSWFGNGRECTYTMTVPDDIPNYDIIRLAPFACLIGPYNTNNQTDWIQNTAAVIDTIESAIQSQGYAADLSINTSTRVWTLITDAGLSIFQMAGSGTGDHFIQWDRISCGSVQWNYPTLSLGFSGCIGSQSITWQYRPDSSTGWQNVQTGGLQYSTCTSGQYRAIGTCGDCDFISNIFTIS